jgi:signal transduction histidine kinase
VADRVALALDNARLYEAERVARAAMTAERDRLQQILDTLPVGVLTLDAAGQLDQVNAAGRDMLGVDARGRPAPPGTAGTDVVLGGRQQRPAARALPLAEELPVARAFREGTVVTGEEALLHQADTGQDLPVLVNSAPLHDAAGTIVGAVAAFQDLTPLRELERAREGFFSAAAHDLKTPLTSIRGQAQLAQRRLARLDTPETAPVLAQLARIQESSDAMVSLIDELVDVTRQQLGGGLDLHRAPTDLVALVQESVESHQAASGRTIQLEVAVPALSAEVDAARLARVVGNLLANALKYSPEGSAIGVWLGQEESAAGPEAVLVVRDEGIGIPAADLPHIFERFRRGLNVVGHIQGTGIGLASARQIVELHGGTIAVESQEGAGSTFTIRLPLP